MSHLLNSPFGECDELRISSFLEGNWKDSNVLFADLADEDDSAVVDVSFRMGGVRISDSSGDSAMTRSLEHFQPRHDKSEGRL